MDLAWPQSPLPIAMLLVAGLLAAWPRAARWLFDELSPRAFGAGCAVAAALLSYVYVVVYLRGGPRIIDATTYYLEARALSGGAFAWPVGEVPASSMGRFLVRDALDAGERAAGIFPPGYPAVLALGFLVGAPMLVGPAIAAASSWAVVDLARSAARALELDEAERAARLAGLLALTCFTLRYHTADTMSHGLAALCFTASLGAAYRMRAGDARLAPLALGLAGGWLVATRPVSALALLVVVALVLWPVLSTPAPARLRSVAFAALTSLPGLALFAWHQRAATGAWLHSSQSLYYALSDGPLGCFRYGFGEGIGCRLEHGDFVAHNLPDGYGAWPAIKTTARRLDKLLFDPLNAKWFGPLALALVSVALRRAASRPLALALPALALAYAPFYFDGNYPGGGARFYADALPSALVCIALVTTELAPRLGVWTGSASWLDVRAHALPLLLSCLGFAFAGHAEHERLRDREGGRPMFLPSDLDVAGVDGGLVFVDTDHGFGLGFDPRARASDSQFEIVRHRGDAHDLFVWERRGRPPATRHVFDVSSGQVEVLPYVPEPVALLEAEALWPALEQSGAYVAPRWNHDACVSGRRTLALFGAGPTPPAGRERRVRLSLPRAVAGRSVVPRVLGLGLPGVELHVDVDGARRVSWAVPHTPGCHALAPERVPLGERVELTWSYAEDERQVHSGLAPVAELDAIVLDPGPLGTGPLPEDALQAP